MAIRSVIPRTCRTSILLLASVLAAGGLAGCRTSTPTPIVPTRPVSSVLALPSAAQIATVDRAGLAGVGVPGRRNEVLGGVPIDARGPSIARVEVRSDQRIVNGRVYGNLRWRTRSVEVRGR
jgi:hypothetical protein